MAAAGFRAGSVCLSASALSGGTLSLLVGAATLTLLALTLFASIINVAFRSRGSRARC